VFFFIGRLMSLILSKTQKVKVRETDNKFTAERNIAGFVVIVAILILRLFIFPKILAKLNVVFISDALFLMVVGWFLGRISLLSNKIEEMAFTEFIKKDHQKTELI
jgi:membrane protein CcdC involved in cytochrome C biogenesis